MKRLWVKLYKNNRLIRDHAVEINGEIDEYGFLTDPLGSAGEAMTEACEFFDSENPIWLESNKEDFLRREKTVFRAGNFMEEPGFDLMEIEII